MPIVGWTTSNGKRHPVYSRSGNQHVRMTKTSLKRQEERREEKRVGNTALTYEQKSQLTNEAFAVEGRKYPVPTENELEKLGMSKERAHVTGVRHARNAMARVSQHGTESEKRAVKEAVARRYPEVS